MSSADDTTNRARVIITAIARDRPGVVDRIREQIEQAGCAIETVSVAALETAVSVTLLIRLPASGIVPLRAALVGLTVQHDITFHVDDVPGGPG